MSEEVKHIMVRIPKKLHKQATKALEKDGRKWQGYLLSQVKKLVKKKGEK